MPERKTGSTVPRRHLGRQLQELRVRAGLTIRFAANALEWSEPKIWRIETGQTSMRSLDVEAMCRVYGADGELTKALMELAPETKARGWWHGYGDAIPGAFDLFLALEGAAARIDAYQPDTVPDLLQTATYARCAIRTRHPDLNTVERRGEVRIRRQAVLRQAAGTLHARFLLNEQALLRQPGSPAAMLEQLDHLAETAGLPTVALRVMPLSARLHLGLYTGAFTQLRFPVRPDGTHSEPPAVYVETFTGAARLEKPDDVEQYNNAFDSMWDAALDERSSADLITRRAAELRTG